MATVKTLVGRTACLLAFSLAVVAAPTPDTSETGARAGQPARNAGSQPPSPVLTALQSELERAQKALAAQDPPPYFLGYTVTDVESVEVSASNGSLESVTRNRTRWLDVSVRVGSYELDNTHRVPGETALPIFRLPSRGPLESDLPALRRALWRATDRAYKEAARQYLRVRTAKDVRVAEEDTSPDFARTGPYVFDEPPAALGSEIERQMEEWKNRVRDYSEEFRRRRHILNSRITLVATATTRYIVTTDGIRAAHGRTLYRLGLLAESKADDGMDLNRYESFEARAAGGLPPPEKVRARITAMAADLEALRKAPVLEPYSGPAILSGRAAAVFFHEALGHRVEGHRQRDAEQGQTFTRKVGEHILPDFLNVYDDPTRMQAGGVDLIGSYRFDDEGVPAGRVAVVENGVLKNFLMSRTPVRGFAASNGHGRAEPGQAPVGRQGNLFVTSARTLSREQLRRRLIEEVRKRGKPYGLLFGDVEGGYTLTHRFVPQVFQVFPLMVWRVYPDGRPDELVRGAELVGTPLVTLGKIIAAGDDPQIFNGYCGAESGFVPVSAVSPSLLVSEMEVQKKAKSFDRPPLLPPPDVGPGVGGRGPGDGSDTVLQAMSDELQRNLEQLRLGDLDRPYYLEYRLADVHKLEVAASLGALTESSFQSYRPLTVGVRVGDFSRDNSNFVSSADSGSTSGEAEQFGVALEPNYAALRQDLWLGADRAYKRALSAWAAKKAYWRSAEPPDVPPDFSRAKPQVSVRPRLEAVAPAAEWTDLVKRLSARLRDTPQVHDSSVRATAVAANEYFANTVGTRLRGPEKVWTLRVSITVTAPDGMRLRGGFATMGDSLDAPPERDLARRVDETLAELLRMAEAPRGEEYVGPVLVEAPAAASAFAALLPRAVVGRRTPLSDNPLMAEAAERDSPSLNSRILPSAFEVRDEPAYELDDEGVPASAVRVIERGLLKRLLVSRTPVKGFPESNGHGRAAPGGPATPAPSHLVVEASGTMPLGELKNRLRALCREQGREYGLLIRRFQTPGFGEELSPEDLEQSLMRAEAPLQPFSVWKIYAADGREEPVRGLRLVELRLAALKTLLAAGNDPVVERGFSSAPAPMSLGGMILSVGGMEGPPFSITAPSVLFDELEFRPQRRAADRGPALPPP